MLLATLPPPVDWSDEQAMQAEGQRVAAASSGTLQPG